LESKLNFCIFVSSSLFVRFSLWWHCDWEGFESPGCRLLPVVDGRMLFMVNGRLMILSEESLAGGRVETPNPPLSVRFGSEFAIEVLCGFAFFSIDGEPDGEGEDSDGALL